MKRRILTLVALTALVLSIGSQAAELRGIAAKPRISFSNTTAICSNVYSIWNPWRNYFESMDISTNIYVADSSTSFEWTKTIYGWA